MANTVLLAVAILLGAIAITFIVPPVVESDFAPITVRYGDIVAKSVP